MRETRGRICPFLPLTSPLHSPFCFSRLRIITPTPASPLPIALMPAISFAPQHNIPFHRVVGDTYPPLRVPGNDHDRYSRTKSLHQKRSQQHNDIYLDTQGVTNGEIPTFFRGSAEHPLTDFSFISLPQTFSSYFNVAILFPVVAGYL